MSTRIIHCIEDDYNQRIVEEALSRLITKKPSHYVSHEVSKITCGNKTWNVTALQLNGAAKMKGEEMEDSFIRRARRKDGVLVFGSGPNLQDGTCRVVVSVFKRKQLDLSHIESHIKNSFCGRVEMGKSIYAARCLEVGGSIFQYTPAFECKAFTEYYHSNAQSMKERTIDTEDNSIIRGKLEVKYVPFNYIGTIERYNLLYPRLNVKNDFSLRLVQLKPSWCGCMLSVMATRVKVTAIETTSCKIPFNEEYRYQEEVREVILKNERVNIVINELDLRGDDRHFELDSSLYSCTLPNLGVTFFSRNCSRRYALRFSITLMCLEQKCTSTFDVTMDVVVPLEEFKKEGKAVYRLVKKKDRILMRRFQNSEVTVQEISKWADREKAIEGQRALSSHICAISGKNHILGVLTVSRFGPVSEKQELLIPSNCDIHPDDLDDVDYTDAIVFSDGGFHFRSKNVDVEITRSPFLSFEGPPKALDSSRNSTYRLEVCNVSFSGEALKDHFDIWLHLELWASRVYVKNLKIVLFTKTVEATALYVRSIELPQLKYEPFEDFTLNLTNGCAKFPKEVFPGILPPFKPTSVTSQSLCNTIICIRLEVKTFFSAAEPVELIEELVVPGDYEALVESSLLPPYVEVEDKGTVVE